MQVNLYITILLDCMIVTSGWVDGRKEKFLKSYKSIEHEKIRNILHKIYPERELPFISQENIPNNWLKLHGYTMHKHAIKSNTVRSGE